MIINSQLGGKKPTGTKNITSNGIHDVADYASADVQVPTTAPDHYIEKTVNANGVMTNSSYLMNFDGVKELTSNCLSYAYYYNTAISGAVRFKDLVKVPYSSASFALYNCFSGAINITSAEFPVLDSVGGNNAFVRTFYECSNIVLADFSNLVTINGSYAFNDIFYYCSALTTVKFDSLKYIYAQSALSQAFGYTALSTLSFPAFYMFDYSTGQFSNMLVGCSNVVLHFPNNRTSEISGRSGYPNFGGTNTTVLFDLPATVILTGANSTQYERNPKYDTATSLSWRVNNTLVTTTPYYTSGTTDPQVGDTIYSDSACTTAVTTISTIA